MKILIIKCAILAFSLFICSISALCQSEAIDIPHFSNIEDLFNSVDALYMALVIILGYLSHLMPFLKNIKDTTIRLVATGILSAIGFVLFGGMGLLNGVINYALSTSFYDIFLKKFKKTTKIKA